MESERPQIIIIHGGDVFESPEKLYQYLEKREFTVNKKKDWKNWLQSTLSEEFEIFYPTMPNKLYVDYNAWKIWFEKLFPLLNNEKIILIGHSLGGTFLAKYLSENKFPKKINQLHLISAVFDDSDLNGETIGNFRFNPDNLKNLQSQADKIFIYHSKDDPLVPFSHAEEYKKHLNSELLTFENRGHIKQPYFLEILQKIINN